jgi:hypothetical protein
MIKDPAKRAMVEREAGTRAGLSAAFSGKQLGPSRSPDFNGRTAHGSLRGPSAALATRARRNVLVLPTTPPTGTFVDGDGATKTSAGADTPATNEVAAADRDLDGDLDIVVANRCRIERGVRLRRARITA